MSEQEKQHQECTNRFIELANQFKDQGIDITLISGAMMTASSIYATYVAAGNEGMLEPSGVDKVVDRYKHTLQHYQHIRKQQLIGSKLA